MQWRQVVMVVGCTRGVASSQAAVLTSYCCSSWRAAVTTTAGFITSSQERAFGDIEIKAGPRMMAAQQQQQRRELDAAAALA